MAWFDTSRSNPATVNKLGVKYLGATPVPPSCERRKWLEKGVYAKLYIHQQYGHVWAVSQAATDGPTLWFSNGGEQLYVEPLLAWGHHSPVSIAESRDWKKQLKYIGRC